MPYIAPAQRASGTRAWTDRRDDPHNGGPCDCDWASPDAPSTAAAMRHRVLPAPDQTRYGPKPPTAVRWNRQRDIRVTREADGRVATCLGCGWLAFSTTVHDLEKRARDHQCPTKKGRSR